MTDFPALYIDVETSDWHEDNSPSLPVQVAAAVTTESKQVGVFCALINQRGWQGIRLNPIAERASKFHGITPEMCDAFGWPPDMVINRLRNMMEKAAVVVAHSARFDLSVLDHACGTQRVPKLCWPDIFCTMVESAPIMRLPSYGKYSIGGFKAPNLKEAFKFFTKREMENHHDALADIRAAVAIHRGILRHRRLSLDQLSSVDRPEAVDSEGGQESSDGRSGESAQ